MQRFIRGRIRRTSLPLSCHQIPHFTQISHDCGWSLGMPDFPRYNLSLKEPKENFRKFIKNHPYSLAANLIKILWNSMTTGEFSRNKWILCIFRGLNFWFYRQCYSRCRDFISTQIRMFQYVNEEPAHQNGQKIIKFTTEEFSVLIIRSSIYAKYEKLRYKIYSLCVISSRFGR